MSQFSFAARPVTTNTPCVFGFGAHPKKDSKKSIVNSIKEDIIEELKQSLSLIHISEPTRPY